MARQTKPNWVLIVLAVVGAMVLGPPLLVLLLGAVGLAFGLLGAVIKFAVVALAIYAAVMLLKGIFGSSPPRASNAVVSGGTLTLDSIDAELEREKRERIAELDRELERAIEQKKHGGA